MKRKEGGRGGEKMSRQCPLCIGWVSPRAFVMLYTDPLSKVVVRLPVQLFSYSGSASFLSLLCDFFFFICDCRADYYRGQQITHRKRQRKRQNKWEAAKILILIRMGEAGKNSCKCTAIQACPSYHLQTENRKKKALDIQWFWSLLWSVMSLTVKVSPELWQEVVRRQRVAMQPRQAGSEPGQRADQLPLQPGG